MATVSYTAGCMSRGVKSPPTAPEFGRGNSSSSIPAAISSHHAQNSESQRYASERLHELSRRAKADAVEWDEVQSMGERSHDCLLLLNIASEFCLTKLGGKRSKSIL